MEYQVQVWIDKDVKTVTDLFLNRMEMPKWEKGLHHIEDTNGHLFEVGSEGYLVFFLDSGEMKMKVTVEKLNIPDSIIMIYEVPGAWNRCANEFREVDDKTLWTMDVTFTFDQEMNVPLIKFIEKTTASMNIFKDFVEGK
jgi:hypothetical protein